MLVIASGWFRPKMEKHNASTTTDFLDAWQPERSTSSRRELVGLDMAMGNRQGSGQRQGAVGGLRVTPRSDGGNARNDGIGVNLPSPRRSARMLRVPAGSGPEV